MSVISTTTVSDPKAAMVPFQDILVKELGASASGTQPTASDLKGKRRTLALDRPKHARKQKRVSPMFTPAVSSAASGTQPTTSNLKGKRCASVLD